MTVDEANLSAVDAAAADHQSFGANAVISAFSWFVPAAAALVALPVTVRGLGADAYGLLALVTALTGYLGLLEMGIAQAVVRYISYHRALGEGKTVVRIVLFALKWFVVVGVVGGLALFFSAGWLAHSVLHVPPQLWDSGVTVLRLAGLNFALGMLVSVGLAVPQGFLRYDIAGGLNGLFGTVAAVGPAVIVMLGHGVVAVTAFFVVANLCAVAVYIVIVVRLLRRLPMREATPWPSVRRRALRFAAVTALTRIHTVVAAQTNRLVVGVAEGTAAAAYYQIPNMLSTRTNELLSRVAQVLFPTGAELLAREDDEGVRVLYLRSSRLFFLLNLSVTLAICVFARPLLDYWIDVAFAEAGTVALAVFTVTQSLNAVTMAASFLNLSSERPGVNLGFSLANSIINLVTVYPLTVRYGISGAALAGLLGAATVPLFMQYTHARILHIGSWLVLRSCYLPTVFGAGGVAALAYFLLRPLCNGLLVTLALWLVTVALSFVAAGLAGAVKRDDLATARRLTAAAWVRVARRDRKSGNRG